LNAKWYKLIEFITFAFLWIVFAVKKSAVLISFYLPTGTIGETRFN